MTTESKSRTLALAPHTHMPGVAAKATMVFLQRQAQFNLMTAQGHMHCFQFPVALVRLGLFPRPTSIPRTGQEGHCGLMGDGSLEGRS